MGALQIYIDDDDNDDDCSRILENTCISRRKKGIQAHNRITAVSYVRQIPKFS